MDDVTLVTGGTGLIGGEVILALAAPGRPVRAVVRASSDEHARRRLVERLEKSVMYRPELMPLVDAIAGDTELPMWGVSKSRLGNLCAIVHCAANTQFSERADEQVWNTNVSGAHHLVTLARYAAPTARIVFVSTASVTTAPERACVSEETPFGGHSNTYTLSKREAEGILMASGLDAVIVRPSIVLSRGVSDRSMARSILWAVPIMGELGDLPVDPDARIDIVPVDHVAQCIARVTTQPALRHRLYHITAGTEAPTFEALREAVVTEHPAMKPIRAIGRRTDLRGRTQTRLLRLLSPYLSFINAGVCYSNARLVEEFGASGRPASALSYLPSLVGLITLREALAEMYQP